MTTHSMAQFNSPQTLFLDKLSTYYIPTGTTMDVDNDGLKDVISINGWFTWRKNYGTYLGNPQEIGNQNIFYSYLLEILDVNYDGLLDIITDFGTYLNTGNGNFTPHLISEYAITHVKDFNGDGYLDLVVRLSSNNANLSKIKFNDGLGNFTTCPSCTIPTGLLTVCDDFNGDNLSDVIVEQGIYLNNGTSNFTAADTIVDSFLYYPQKFGCFDTDNNGVKEIYYNNNEEILRMEYSNGNWDASTTPIPNESWLEFRFGNVNNDALTDVILEKTGISPPQVWSCLTDSSSEINEPQLLFENENLGSSLEGNFTDLNADNIIDCWQVHADSVYFWLNDGMGNYTEQTANFPVYDFRPPIISDFNNDNISDIVYSDANGEEQFAIGDGSLNFIIQPQQLTISPSIETTQVLEYDNDNLPDILFSTRNEIVQFKNMGNLEFLNPQVIFENTDIVNFQFEDADMDGDKDLFVSKMDGSLELYANSGTNNFSFEQIVVEPAPLLGIFPTRTIRFKAADLFGDPTPEIITHQGWGIDTIGWNQDIHIKEQVLLRANNTYTSAIVVSDYNDTGYLFSIYNDTEIKAGDFNSDGKTDYALSNGINTFRYGIDGPNFLSLPQSDPNFSISTQGGNIDSDSNIEFLASSNTNEIIVYEVDSNMTMMYDTLALGPIYASKLLDCNNDFLLDILQFQPPSWNTAVHINEGNNQFTTFGNTNLQPISPEYPLIQKDLDLDGDQDLVWQYMGILIAENTGQSISSIHVNTFLDVNGNGTNDNEPVLPYQPITLSPPGSTYYTNSNGNTAMVVIPGEYDVQANNSSIWQLSGNTSYNVSIGDSTEVVNLDFGYVPLGFSPQIGVSYLQQGNLCDTLVLSYISAVNYGNTSGQVIIQLETDSLCHVLSSNFPFTAEDNTYTWTIDSIGFVQNHNIEAQLSYPGVGAIGDQLIHALSWMQVDGNNAIITSDSLLISEVIECGYDPNDITETKGWTDEGYILSGDVLQYTIRFQNTGNANTENVRIENQLSDLLDKESFQVIAWSHDFNVEIDENRKAIFHFPEINLPDSGSNQLESNGFITYRIHSINDIDPRTSIYNTADIYFDMNPPVITNTESNLIYDCTGISTFILSADSICPGTEIIGTSVLTPLTQYIWNVDGINLSNETPSNLTIYIPGEHSIQMEATNVLCNEVTEQEIFVFAPQVPVINLNEGIFYSSGIGSLQWLLDGVIINGANTSAFVPESNGVYSVSLMDVNGCTSVSQGLLYTGINELTQNQISIIPNPVTSESTLNLPPGKWQIEIYNIMGELVSKWNNIQQSHTITHYGISGGTYLLRICDESGHCREIVIIME
jgi:uncharacterized repeat protein (TIGR01451 family)